MIRRVYDILMPLSMPTLVFFHAMLMPSRHLPLITLILSFFIFAFVYLRLRDYARLIILRFDAAAAAIITPIRRDVFTLIAALMPPPRRPAFAAADAPMLICLCAVAEFSPDMPSAF